MIRRPKIPQALRHDSRGFGRSLDHLEHKPSLMKLKPSQGERLSKMIGYFGNSFQCSSSTLSHDDLLGGTVFAPQALGIG